jgi:hypothetical protein
MKFHPKLAPLQRTALKNAIEQLKHGRQPVIGLRYEGGSKRKPGVDYVGIPGLAEDAHLGPLSRATEDKLFLQDIARSDGEKPGISSIRIEAILEFAVAYWRDIAEDGRPSSGRHLRVTTPTRERTRSGKTRAKAS